MRKEIIVVSLVLITTLFACKKEGKSNDLTSEATEKNFNKGTFGYDVAFLSEYYKKTIVLESDDKKASIVLSPELQGRVMTSTLNGDDGMSFGWLNYDLISSGEVQEHINVTGGEERFWLGPEGGQFSIFFKEGSSFEFENWYVPASLDTEEFDIVEQNKSVVIFNKDLEYTNYSGTDFELNLNRKVSLLSNAQVQNKLDIHLNEVQVVAYESQNIVKNTGANAWEEKSGLLSIWLLSMMNSSPEVTAVAPIKDGDEAELGTRVNDNYFGAIAADRLKTTAQNVYFKADGDSRGKIGISPKRSTKFIGSYDAKNKVLTILEIDQPNADDKYVNSAWELQDDPYSGDVLNSYNDGKLEDGSQLGPFYELESSSPALALKPNEAYNHTQSMYHFKGDQEALNEISVKLLGVSLEEIEAVF